MKIKPVYLLAFILAIATLYFYQDPQSNGNSRLAVIRAIVEHGSLQIDGYQQDPTWSTMDRAMYNGHYYGDKAIGTWLLGVPFYFLLYKMYGLLGLKLTSALIKHVLTTLVMGTAFTINGVVMYRTARLVTPKEWKAALAALALALGTMLWPYSVVFYGHVLAAMFLSIAFYLLLTIRLSPRAATAGRYFWTGLSMGFAFITDYTTALIIVGLLVYALYLLRRQNMRVIARFALYGLLGAALPMACLMVYNLLVYGTPFTFGYSYDENQTFAQGFSTGFMGVSAPRLLPLYHITLDPQFGLFWQSPVLILAFVGSAVALKTKSWRAEVLLSFYALLSIALMDSGFYSWWGGSAFGPRYLIVALPLFIVPLALMPDRLTWLLAALGALSAGQMLIPLLGKVQIGLDYDPAKDQFSVNQPFTGFSILYQYGIPIILKLHRKDTLPWNLGSALGLPYRYSAALLVAAEAALSGWLYVTTRGKAGNPPGETLASPAQAATSGTRE